MGRSTGNRPSAKRSSLPPSVLTEVFIVGTITAVRIEFDAAKDEANRDKHGISLGDAARLEWETALAKPDRRRDYGEPREIGYGLIDGRLHCVVFVRRGAVFRIISLRKANQREVRNYEQQTKTD